MGCSNTANMQLDYGYSQNVSKCPFGRLILRVVSFPLLHHMVPTPVVPSHVFCAGNKREEGAVTGAVWPSGREERTHGMKCPGGLLEIVDYSD